MIERERPAALTEERRKQALLEVRRGLLNFVTAIEWLLGMRDDKLKR